MSEAFAVGAFLAILGAGLLASVASLLMLAMRSTQWPSVQRTLAIAGAVLIVGLAVTFGWIRVVQ